MGFQPNARPTTSGRRGTWLGIAAILLQLTIPCLHSLELAHEAGSPPSSWSERSAAGEPGTAVSDARPASHDAHSCPICSALAHAHATPACTLRMPVRLESRPKLVVADAETPPASALGSAEARAPPLPALIAIS